MKKSVLLVLGVLFGIGVYAQKVDFGVTAGYLYGYATLKTDQFDVSVDDSGFYLGALVDLGLTEKLSIRPELLYASIDDSSALFLPIMLKVYVLDRLHLQAGPQFVFSLEESTPDFSSYEIDLAGGLGFDITSNFFLESRASFQLNNSFTGNEDIKARANYLTVGVGYKF